MQNSLILILAALPGLAAAQDFEGATGEFQYQKYDDGDGFKVDSIEGYLDAAWGFGRFGAQVGLSLGKEIDSSADIDFRQYKGLTGHLTADVSDNLRLGVMVNADNAVDGVAVYAAEAIYLAGPLRVEGRVGDSLNSDAYSLVEVKGTFAIGTALSARAGMHYSDYGTEGFYRVLTLGAGYRLGDSTEVYADLSRHTNDFGALGSVSGDLVNLGIRFDLGGEGDRLFSYQPLN